MHKLYLFAAILLAAVATFDALTLSKTTNFMMKSATLLPCPKTRWPSHQQQLFNGNKQFKPNQQHSVTFVKQISRPPELIDEESEYQWLEENASYIMQSLSQHGAIHFTNFQSTKSKEGFRSFVTGNGWQNEYPSSSSSGTNVNSDLTFIACQDPLERIGVRSFLSASDGVYKAVDSERLSRTFIGLHNDCTFHLAPPYAAFGCFQQAEQGGEFLLADGSEVLNALNVDIMAKMYKRKVRVRVAALPTPFLKKLKTWEESNRSNDSTKSSSSYNSSESQYQFMKVDAAKVVRDMIATLIQFLASWGLSKFLADLGLQMAFSDDYSMLQILEPLKSPINIHPQTGEMTFFSGIHSQSTYLQQKRSTNGFAGVAVTDVFYGEYEKETQNKEVQEEGLEHGRKGREKHEMIVRGEMEAIEPHVLDHIENVMNEHTTRILMKPGDIVLLDSYRVLHGRDVFEGPREHGVIWLTSAFYL